MLKDLEKDLAMKAELLVGTKSFKIENYGCQMNLSDTEEVEASLYKGGFGRAADASDADIVIINSCAIRQTAEKRVYGRLKEYHTKKANKDQILVLMGCVAQKDKYEIIENMPWIDLVIGTHEKSRTVDIIKDYILKSNTSRVHTEFGGYEFMDAMPSLKYPFKADLTIIHGCNKDCSYCIVPSTRGIEISRKSKQIIDNVKRLIDGGVSEIMLLGQNVNSYNIGTKDIRFPELLLRLSELDKLKRIRFLTSHPMDFSNDLISAIKVSDKICNYVHLPLQSGSNKVLKDMKREYTYQNYKEIIYSLREELPKIVLSTDILVGFPGESIKDFEYTLKAMEEIMFDTAYMFKYSKRSGTQAASYTNYIEEEDKQSRLSKIIDTQSKITKERNARHIGQIEEVLIEGHSKRDPEKELLGKTGGNKNVIVRGDKSLIGNYFNVVIEGLRGNTLIGRIIN